MKGKIYFSILFTIFFVGFFLKAAAETPVSSAGAEQMESVVKKVFPSVVKVETMNRMKKVATGVVIGKEGHIVTTALISPRDERVVIITSDGKREEAEFLGMDSETHIAVLKVKERKLPSISLGKAKDATTGTWVGIVSVSPENTPAATQGIVSSASAEELRLNVWVLPGWSGSPVVNRDGLMVGLLRGIYTDEQPVVFEFREKEVVGSGYVYSFAEAPSSGIALAVPIDIVEQIADEIIKKGKVERGWLGVLIGQMSDGKVRIVSIERESPAELANLKEGDIILKVEGKDVIDSEMLMREIKKRKPGKDVALEIDRNGKTLQVKVKLGEYPERELRREFEIKFPRLFPPEGTEPIKPPKLPEEMRIWPQPERMLPFYNRTWEAQRYIGVFLEELTEELSRYFGVEKGRGLVVSRFSDESPAQKAGLKIGDVIIGIDGERVETISRLSELIQKKKEGDKVKVEFLRDKKVMSVEVEVKEEKRQGVFRDFFFSRD